MDTSLNLYLNEVRVMELHFFDNFNSPLKIDGAFIDVFTTHGKEVVLNQPALVMTNKVSTVIDEKITEKANSYVIIWKLKVGQNIFVHRTALLVRDLV